MNEEMRSNLVRWIPWSDNSDVLYFGIETDALAVEISKRVQTLTCVNSEEVQCGTYLKQCEKKFDAILLANVLEHSGDLCGSTEVLLSCKNHLHENGQIIVACDNSLGMRYWAGMNQGDSEMSFFARIQGKETERNSREFTRVELEKMIADAGLVCDEFYYPYPNTAFPMAVYSDSYLPHKGELNINNYYMGVEHMELFDETKAFDTVLGQGMFPFFSNSYMVFLHV